MFPAMFDPAPPPPEGLVAEAGEPLAPGLARAAHEHLEQALRSVHDPEIPINIFDLGLIYSVDQKDDGDVDIFMTLTAPACPVAGELPQDVANAVARAPGVGRVKVSLTWDPPWTPERMSDAARVALDMF